MNRVLTATERQSYQERITEIDRAMKHRKSDEAGVSRSDVRNRDVLMQKRNSYQETLDKGKPVEYSDSEKDTACKRQKELEKDIRGALISRNDMMAGRSIERNVRFHKAYKGKISEYQSLSRSLEPDNPEAGSIEKLRKD